MDRIRFYKAAKFIYIESLGYIVWHYSTGENIEILFIEADKIGAGNGLLLYKKFVESVLESGEKPYNSVFSFRLGNNEAANSFYRKLGWIQVDLGFSLYRGINTVLMWISWEDLKRKVL